MFYPDRVVNPKFNQQTYIKPLLTQQKPVRPPSVKYQKFGMNLGPSQPVRTLDKYANKSTFTQSPMYQSGKARADVSSCYLVNHDAVAKRLQDRINQQRRQHFEKTRETQ